LFLLLHLPPELGDLLVEVGKGVLVFFDEPALLLDLLEEVLLLLFGTTASLALHLGVVVDEVLVHLLVLVHMGLIHLVPVLGHFSVFSFAHPQNHLPHLFHQPQLSLKSLLQLLQSALVEVLHLFGDLLALSVDTSVWLGK
jgi:hypothetical protein